MSLGDEHDSRRTEDAYSTVGGTRQTRTRLPEGEGADVYGGARRPVRASRSLLTVVGVVVLLVAAIAFANRGDGGDTSSDDPKHADPKPTAATGVNPVQGKTAGIATGFPQTEQGAQSAAANYAVALGSDGMFNTAHRHTIVEAVADASSKDKLQSGFDTNYSPGLNQQIGLTADGAAPAGTTFVNRTVPAGTKVQSYSPQATSVDVWCIGLFGLTGEKSTKPVTTNWFTMTLKLAWNGSDWKVLETAQKKGPTPVTGDNTVSGSEEIANAVKEFGGFTYAR
ncbi:hypothetical protein [Streptomyces sp. BPTC-684]|uniref:hypothetical protein n=1 Tax=Streptomyces sp. BPTC-684 TaxID=3043734 RepID=UPI0024B0F90D|nr:hypothetical protein [Streptomyces sp. BPTC-684]WHM37517.1 hypothetical protein QIY60_11760 [Streptomyces sp. BPTC-684]